MATTDRVLRSKAQARVAYDRMSLWYDALAEGSEGRITQEGLRAVDLRPAEAALEIGFGTGHSLVAMAHAVGREGRVVGVDISRGMLEVARDRVRKAGSFGWTALLFAEAARLPFRDGVFDAAFMSYTLELIDTPEIPAVLGECRRVLRRRGRLGVVALAPRPGGVVADLYGWAHRHFPTIADCRPIPAARLIEAAGFRLAVREERSMWGLPVDVVVGERP